MQWSKLDRDISECMVVPRHTQEHDCQRQALYSLVETAKANSQEPYAYLRHILERLQLAKTLEDYGALLPQNFSPATTS